MDLGVGVIAAQLEGVPYDPAAFGSFPEGVDPAVAAGQLVEGLAALLELLYGPAAGRCWGELVRQDLADAGAPPSPWEPFVGAVTARLGGFDPSLLEGFAVDAAAGLAKWGLTGGEIASELCVVVGSYVETIVERSLPPGVRAEVEAASLAAQLRSSLSG